MKVGEARHVLRTIASGVMTPGALYVSGYLDSASEAEKTVKRANAKNAARRKAPTHKTKKK